jgi:hypothetical protein
MTRKDFIALADALIAARPDEKQHAPACFETCYSTWEVVCDEIARACSKSNPRFNRAKFIEYTRKGGAA